MHYYRVGRQRAARVISCRRSGGGSDAKGESTPWRTSRSVPFRGRRATAGSCQRPWEPAERLDLARTRRSEMRGPPLTAVPGRLPTRSSLQAHQHMHIRLERPEDATTIHALTDTAFKGRPFSDGTEAQVIDALRATGALDPFSRGDAGRRKRRPYRVFASHDQRRGRRLVQAWTCVGVAGSSALTGIGQTLDSRGTATSPSDGRWWMRSPWRPGLLRPLLDLRTIQTFATPARRRGSSNA